MAFLTDKYPRTMHLPFSPGAKNDDRIAEAGWFEYFRNHHFIYTEKLDGQNQCMSAKGLFARSHAVVDRLPWSTYLWPIYETIKYDLGNLEIFGENMYAIHSIEYSELSDYFYVFGVRENGVWYSWNDVKYTADYFNFPTVPQFSVDSMKPDTPEKLEALIMSLVRKSHFGDTCEGVVMRNFDSFDDVNDGSDLGFNVLKWVRKGHVQTDEHWTRNWKKAKLKR
jgi:hypothetical protein